MSALFTASGREGILLNHAISLLRWFLRGLSSK